MLKTHATEHLVSGKSEDHGKAYQDKVLAAQEKGKLDPAIMFTTGEFEGKYTQYDERGVPTHDEASAELPKSQKKKLEKLYAAQVKKFEKYKAEGGVPAEKSAPTKTELPASEPTNEADQCPLRVIPGTFGHRQGYEMSSKMGPFTHMFTW